MKSVGVRIAFWYALASLLTLGCFFRVGRYLVEQHMIHSLDIGLMAEFEQVKRRLGPDADTLEAAQISEKLMRNASVRFSIEVHEANDTVLYRSRNLRDLPIPATPTESHLSATALNHLFSFLPIGTPRPDSDAVRTYDAVIEGLGEMHIGEFRLNRRLVRVAVSKEQVRTLVVAFQDVFYGMVILMLIASSLIGFFLSYILLRPLRQIQATATHISSTNLSERIPVATVNDEISNLARLLNQTFDRLESSFNQVRRFSAEASHELKTPLSLMQLQTEKMLLEGGLNPTQEESLHVVIEEITRLNQIIEELLFLSRAEADAITLNRQRLDPRFFMESIAQDARVLADSRGLTFGDFHSGEGWVDFDPRWLRQVSLNLLTNAFNYTPPGQAVRLISHVTADAWRVAIEDEGPGVPPDQREQIFERFFRLAHPGQHDKGSGLGLAICRSIITLHQGKIWAENASSGHGLRVTFELPRTADPSEVSPR